MTVQALETTDDPELKPNISRLQALIMMVFSIIAMSIGWLLAAHIPLWLAPPLESLGWTFLSYLILPSLLWGAVPLLLVRRWKLTRSDEQSLYWIVRYTMLFIVWMFGFWLVFGATYHEDVFIFNLMFNINGHSCEQIEPSEDGITYHCTPGSVFAFYDNSPNPNPTVFTFEGRDGLPFVWYTGVLEEAPNTN